MFFNAIKFKYGAMLAMFVAVINIGANCQEDRISFQSIDEGLSNKFVRNIIKDHNGFLWFGTYNGLNKFDGTRFYTYEHNPSDSNSICHGTINALFEDSENTLWIGTVEGLNLYNKQYNNFIGIRKADGLTNTCITAICGPQKNEVWVGTLGGGINIYNTISKTFTFIYISGTPLLLSDESYINCMHADKNKNIWVGTRKGLFLFESQKKQEIYFNIKNQDINLKSTNISCITLTNNGDLWVATSKYGLMLLHRTGNDLENYIYSVEKNYKNLLNIKSLNCDKYNNLWIGTENEGLLIFDSQNEKFSKYLPEEGNLKSISSNSIWAVYTDNENKTWIGTYNKGICLYDKYYEVFPSFNRNPFRNKSLSDNDVTCFTQDFNGLIWIGTDGGGLHTFNRNKQEIVDNISNKSNKFRDFNDVIKSIICDKQNTIWAGTWGDGIYKITNNGNKIEKFNVTAGNIGDNFILCLYTDSESNIWAGSAGSGLFILKPSQHEFEPANEKNYGITIPSYGFVTSIREDKEHNIWVATLYGLYVLTKNNNSRYFSKSFFHSESRGTISSDRIQVVYEDNNSTLWFGTFDNGLNRFNKSDSTFSVINVSNGLASNMINGIEQDYSGNLWISSNRGITKYNIEKNTSKIYNKNNGLISDEFYMGASCKLSDGEFLFGSDKGYIYFSPDSIKINPIKPVMYLTGLRINNVPVTIGAENSPLQKHISESDKIVLNYKQTNFTIEFTGISYTRPGSNTYRYKMIGLSNSWNYIGSQASITFSTLGRGKYKLVIEGANNDGIWCDNPAEIVIVIKPPVWKTWAAFILYFITFLSITFIIFRSRIEKVRIENSLKIERIAHEKEHELNQSKLQFFTNISHEFRTPLSLIIAPLESILASHNIKNEYKSKILGIYKNANKLMQLINELMDFRKIENNKMQLKIQQGNLIKFLSELILSFRELAKQKNIDLSFHTSIKNTDYWFDSNKLEKILLNLLSNSFNHTPEKGSIRMELSLNDKNEAIISVTDNGTGILPDDLPYIFERFFQSKLSMGKGTGIGLALVKNLIELHHGKIEAESTPGIGTRMTITFPVSKSAYSESEISLLPVDIKETDKSLNITADSKGNDNAKNENIAENPEILIVEDNESLREYLINELGKNFNIISASDGEEGVNMALEKVPDLILSDVLMPQMSGIEMCKRLKNDIRTSHIPVVLLTAKTTIEDQVEGIETGAEVYITKPFSIRFLEAQIKQIVQTRENLYKVFSQEAHLMPAQLAKNKVDEEFLITIVNFIIDNITDSQLGVEILADSMNLSRGHFYKKIKALTGQTAVEFIRNIRLKEAIKLMEARKYSLAEIAYQTGFTSPSYFTRSFKEQYGKSPSDFLK